MLLQKIRPPFNLSKLIRAGKSEDGRASAFGPFSSRQPAQQCDHRATVLGQALLEILNDRVCAPTIDPDGINFFIVLVLQLLSSASAVCWLVKRKTEGISLSSELLEQV